MQVSIEVKQGLQRNVFIKVPAEEVMADYQKKLIEFSKNTKRIKGFRPGKAKASDIKRLFGNEVKAQLLREVMSKHLAQAVEDNKLRPVNQPKIHIHKADDNEPLEFSAEFEIFPEVKLDKIETIKISQPKVEITETVLNKTLESMREEFGVWESVESRPAAKNDLVEVDFAVQTDELKDAEKQAKNFKYQLDKGQMIPGFDEQVIGMTLGETKMFDVVFPEAYHNKVLAGKPMKIEVTLHSISQKRLATDDELFSHYNLEEKSLEALKKLLKEGLEKQIAAAARVKMKEQLLDQLLELHPVQLPETLVKHEEEVLKRHQLQLLIPKIQEAQQSGLSEEEAALKVCEDEAKRKVGLSMLLGEYIRENEIKQDHQRVMDTMQEMVRGHQDPGKMLEWIIKDQERLHSVITFVLEEQAVDSMLEKVQKTEQPIEYEDLLKM